jgi:glucose-1-phosphate thymidylyltransferase
MARAIGVVPAAGAGSRLWPFRATKELIQVGYGTVRDGGPGRLVPRTAIDHVLAALRRGGVDDVLVVLSPAKWEVFRYLGTGREIGLNRPTCVRSNREACPGPSTWLTRS